MVGFDGVRYASEGHFRTAVGEGASNKENDDWSAWMCGREPPDMLLDEIERINALSGLFEERAVRVLKRKEAVDGGRRKTVNINI